MIISASRRTDIPAFYSDWFFTRLKEGCALTRNPMNHSQIRRVSLLLPEVDCFVFWSKNPAPMLPRLGELAGFMYYFQFTLTPYGIDTEAGLPHKSELTDTFKRLSEAVGAQRVIWRYDPVFLSDRYSLHFHLSSFGELAHSLRGYTQAVTISFIELYPKLLKRFPAREVSFEEKEALARGFFKIAEENNMVISACAESADLSPLGVGRAACVDGALIERLTGRDFGLKKDKNQRPACGCVQSVDIGAYNTCQNGCIYCYANYSGASILKNVRRHDPRSPEMLG